MSFNWNVLGICAWIILILIFIFMVWDVRRRHLKLAVTSGKNRSFTYFTLDIIEFGVVLALTCGMFYVTFLDHVDINNAEQVKLTYEVKPLVMQTQDAQGFYVKAKKTDQKDTVQYYTYWTHGAKYSVPGNNASISETDQSTTLNAKNYPWPSLKKYDKQYQGAYVITMVARYKDNWRNGLGVHAGNVATDYSLIRLPSDTFVKMIK